MDRRDFFKKTILAGVAAGAAMTLGDLSKVIAGKIPAPTPTLNTAHLTRDLLILWQSKTASLPRCLTKQSRRSEE